MKILVVDDEPTILETIEYKLRKEGLTPFTAMSAEEGMRLFRQIRPDLVVLDVMLPQRSGFDLCRAIRKDHQTPILFLTARASDDDRISGLDLGADDYMTKPFNMSELVARIRAIMRRSGVEAPQNMVEIGDLRIDPKVHEATLDGKILSLSLKEFLLLYFFASHPGQAFTRDQLLDRVWGPDAYVNARTVDVHVRWLRVHIEKDPSSPKRILTVRGIGYKFTG